MGTICRSFVGGFWIGCAKLATSTPGNAYCITFSKPWKVFFCEKDSIF